MDSEQRQAWLEERRRAIGASDAPAVLGVSPWSSPLAVWADKLGITVDDFDDAQLERMEWGHILEPVIILEYERRRGIRVTRHDQTEVIRHPRDGVPMACTPDAYDADGRLVQIKCVDRWTADRWDDGVPLYVEVQEQAEMACTGIKEATVVALIGGNEMRYYDLERNDAFIASLEDKLTLWWRQYVVDRVEPPADGSDSSLRMLERLHPDDSDESVYLGAEFIEIADDLTEIKAKQVLLGKQRKELESRIKAALGSATFGILPGDAGKFSWKTQQRDEYVCKASKYRVLRRHSK